MIRFLAIFTVAAFWGINFQSSGNYVFNSIENPKMPLGHVTDMVFDTEGYLWQSSDNGVWRSDGYKSENYELDHLEEEGYVGRINEDGNGNIWIHARNRIYLFDRRKEEITDMKDSVLSAMGINDEIYKVYIDNIKNVWCVSSDTLYHYDCQGRKLTGVPIPGHLSVKDISARYNTAVVLCENGDFFQVDIVQKRFIYESTVNLSEYMWHYLYLDSEYGVWFYTAHSPKDGLKRWSLSRHSWNHVPELEHVSNTIVNNVLDDGCGRLWIGTEDEGVFVYDFKDRSVTNLQNECNRPGSLPGNHIARFYKDPYGHMWVLTTNDKVGYTDLNPPAFGMQLMDSAENITCVSEDHQGNIWVGYDGDGIILIRKNGKKSFFNKAEGSLPTNIVTCSAVDPQGKLWVGTFGGGILHYSGGKFNTVVPDVPEVQTANISAIAADDSGGIWFGTNAYGLMRLSPDGSIDQFDIHNSPIAGNAITCLHVDRKSHMLYIGTTHGLACLELDKHQFHNLDNEDAEFRCNAVLSVYKDDDGLLWVGTDQTLEVYDENSGMVYDMTHHDIAVKSIMPDKYGNIWVGADQGLIKVNAMRMEDGTYRFNSERFYDESGLDDVDFSRNASVLTSSGQCLIGTDSGLVYIMNETACPVHASSTVRFTGFDAAGISFRPEGPISLKHNQNNFSLDVSVMDMFQQHKIQYEYRIKEHNSGWIELKGNEIIFNALPSGSHTIEVRACDRFGWQSDVSSLEVLIRPAWWKSRAAYFAYVLLLFMVIAYALMRLQKNHHVQMNIQRLESELARQQEMEEAKMRFFTNINHDLRTPLSLVISPLEKILKETASDDIRDNLDIALRNARVLMDEFNQQLDFRRLDVGMEKLFLVHGDIVPLLKDVVLSFKDYADRHKINVRMRCDDVIEMDYDKTKIRRILSNLLSNAVKYSQENGVIEVTAECTKDVLTIEVADNGVGISDKDKPNIFDRFYQCHDVSRYTGSGIGLHIVKEYVSLMNGTVSVRDNQPQGCIFTITIPIKTEEHLSYEELHEYSDMDSVANHDNKGSGSILIVDDNAEFRDFMERHISHKFNVRTAQDGKAALAVLEKDEVDLIISDVMMPEMNGLELCSRVKSDIRTSHIPVILLTAKTSEIDLLEGLKTGADDYIMKPFSLDVLELRINKMFEWSQINRKAINKGLNIEPSEITVSSLDQQLVEKAIRIVEDNIDVSEFSVEELSREIGLTRGHLYKKFMFIMGVSPMTFIRIIRVKRGKALMDQGWNNISEVAYSVGFSPKQFSKHFKQIYGVLPSEYVKSRPDALEQ